MNRGRDGRDVVDVGDGDGGRAQAAATARRYTGCHPTFTMPRHATTTLLVVATLALTGCDQLGIESPAAVAAKREAESKAIGAGCRHGARSVEACYDLNKRADKAAMFAGWREMNDYMRENKIEAMPAAPPQAVAAAESDEAEAGETAAKPGKAATKKH